MPTLEIKLYSPFVYRRGEEYPRAMVKNACPACGYVFYGGIEAKIEEREDGEHEFWKCPHCGAWIDVFVLAKAVVPMWAPGETVLRVTEPTPKYAYFMGFLKKGDEVIVRDDAGERVVPLYAVTLVTGERALAFNSHMQCPVPYLVDKGLVQWAREEAHRRGWL